MPEQTTTFAPSRLDLTGLRAGHIVDYGGVLYDIERLEVDETLGGRDHNHGAPLAIKTTVDIHLQRARWLEKPWIERPAEVLVLPDLNDVRCHAVINGQAYVLHSLFAHRAYFEGLRRPRAADEPPPEYVDLQLVRNPLADQEADHA